MWKAVFWKKTKNKPEFENAALFSVLSPFHLTSTDVCTRFIQYKYYSFISITLIVTLMQLCSINSVRVTWWACKTLLEDKQ